MDRKLAAILFSDIAGFTQLTAGDEEKAVNLINHQRELFQPIVAEFDGELAVIDYKTSTYRKTWEMCHKFFMQGTFYAHAFEERTGTPIENIVIIKKVPK